MVSVFPNHGRMPHYTPVMTDEEKARMPAAILLEQPHDPAWGQPGAPPNYGKYVVPHIFTVSGRASTVSKVYMPYDEAIRDSLDNARFMRNEPSIMECIEARQRATSLLNYHLVPEDEKDGGQKEMCQQLLTIMERSKLFMDYRFNLMHAIWYGKYGVQHKFTRQKVQGKYRTVLSDWLPLNGDKILFRYDDSTGRFKEGQVGIRIGAGYQGGAWINGAAGRNKIEATDQGLAYFLDDWERDLLAVHKHIIEDGTYEDVYSSGSVHGVGIRSRIYATWLQMQEATCWLMEYLERSAFGIELWKYPAGNPAAEAKARTAAEERIGGGRSIVLVPIPQGDDHEQFGVEHIEPGMAGAQEVHNIVTNLFGHRIKRYILGQVLTSESEATGLGSGVADLHESTWLDIVRFDARKLSETITEQLVERLKAYNFPKYKDCYVKFVIDTESADSQKKLEAWKAAFEMGLALKESDVAQLIGASIPDPNDKVLSLAQQQKQEADIQTQMAQQQAAAQQPQGAGGQTEQAMMAAKAATGTEVAQATGQGQVNEDPNTDQFARRRPVRYEFREEDHPRESNGEFAPKGEGTQQRERRAKTEPRRGDQTENEKKSRPVANKADLKEVLLSQLQRIGGAFANLSEERDQNHLPTKRNAANQGEYAEVYSDRNELQRMVSGHEDFDPNAAARYIEWAQKEFDAFKSVDLKNMRIESATPQHGTTTRREAAEAEDELSEPRRRFDDRAEWEGLDAASWNDVGALYLDELRDVLTGVNETAGNAIMEAIHSLKGPEREARQAGYEAFTNWLHQESDEELTDARANRIKKFLDWASNNVKGSAGKKLDFRSANWNKEKRAEPKQKTEEEADYSPEESSVSAIVAFEPEGAKQIDTDYIAEHVSPDQSIYDDDRLAGHIDADGNIAYTQGLEHSEFFFKAYGYGREGDQDYDDYRHDDAPIEEAVNTGKFITFRRYSTGGGDAYLWFRVPAVTMDVIERMVKLIRQIPKQNRVTQDSDGEEKPLPVTIQTEPNGRFHANSEIGLPDLREITTEKALLRALEENDVRIYRRGGRVMRYNFVETDHPRGKPKNKGQFAPKGKAVKGSQHQDHDDDAGGSEPAGSQSERQQGDASEWLQHLPEPLREKVRRLEPGRGRQVELTSEEVHQVLTLGHYALVSAGAREGETLDEATIQQRTAALKQDLVQMGFQFSDVQGHYGSKPEASFMVMCPDAKREEAVQLGRKYQQDAIIYSENNKNEWIYTSGEHDGHVMEGNGWNPVREGAEYFSDIKTLQGQHERFILNFDWGKVSPEKRYSGPFGRLGPERYAGFRFDHQDGRSYLVGPGVGCVLGVEIDPDGDPIGVTKFSTQHDACGKMAIDSGWFYDSHVTREQYQRDGLRAWFRAGC